MLLAVDVGNTDVTFGVFDGERLAARKLVCAAVRCPFDIDIVSKGKIFIDAKSILGVLSLDVEEPLELKYDGYDEDFESVIAGLAC